MTKTAAASQENLGVLLVAIGSVGFGLNSYLATQAYALGVSPEATTLGRALIPLIFMLPFLPGAFKYRRLMVLAIVAGFLMSIGNLAFFRAVQVVPIATASLVFYTYPLFGLGYGVLFFKHKLTRLQAVGAGMILLGAGIALFPNIHLDSGVTGVIFTAFLAPLFHGFALNLFSTSLNDMPPLPKMVAVSLGSVLFLLPMTYFGGHALLPQGGDAMLAVGILGFFGVLIPAFFFVWGAPKAGLGKTAILSGVEFVVSLASGWFLLAQGTTINEVIGAGIVLAAAIMIGLPRRAAGLVDMEDRLT